MCLYRSTEDNPLMQADKDIVCYKVLSIVWKDRTKFKTKFLRNFGLLKHFETWYQEAPVTIGKTVIAEPELSKQNLDNIEKYYISLRDGFIHSYQCLEDACKFREGSYRKEYAVVVKCIIPKGTYYFTGTDDMDCLNYASCAIKYVKVINRMK